MDDKLKENKNYVCLDHLHQTKVPLSSLDLESIINKLCLQFMLFKKEQLVNILQKVHYWLNKVNKKIMLLVVSLIKASNNKS